MYPSIRFGAVRRLIATQMAREASMSTQKVVRPRFNCKLERRTISNVRVGVTTSLSLNLTRVFSVPFLTNSCSIGERELLFLETFEKKKNQDLKRAWRDARKEQEATEARTKALKGKQPVSQ